MRPRTDYSAKQFKLRGKRQCSECVSWLVASAQASRPLSQSELMSLTDDSGARAVKEANAEAIRKAQLSDKGADGPPKPEADKYEVMLKWLRDGGAVYPNLQLKYYAVDYRGVHAKKRLDPGECILEVPLKMIMTSDKAKASAIGRAMASARGAQVLSSHSWLAAFLLQEKENKESFFKPYIDCLPKHYRNMPVFFEQSELKELEGSFTLEMISNRKVSLRMEYDAIANYCPEFARFSLLQFMWARLAVITRIFGFEINGVKTDGLVAMADMLNHKNPHETSWQYEDSKGAFTITTTKKLLKGAQIFDSYGRKCNSRYFVNYGFSLDVNEDNQVAMVFGLKPAIEDPLHILKAQLLGRHERRFQIPFDHREEITTECMAYLRVVHASMEELEQLQKQGSDFKQVAPLSKRNEADMLQTIATDARRVLRGFRTTLEEDNALLEDKNHTLTMNMRNCIVMRRGEKEVLAAYIDLAPRAARWAQMSFTEFKRDFNANIKGRGPEPSFGWRLETYVTDIWSSSGIFPLYLIFYIIT